jgi:hypothetical protein
MFNSIYHRSTNGCLLFVTVLKPSQSSSTVETLGKGTGDAASKINPRSVDSFEGEAICADPEITATV